MATVGRNDPCPCGSGKKFKKCHGISSLAQEDLIYQKIRRLDGESSEILTRFAKQQFGEHALDDAWNDFWFTKDDKFNPNDEEIDTFQRWFHFNWQPRGNNTLAELFLTDRSTEVTPDLRHFIEQTSRAPYSYFQVLDFDPGVDMKLRDILLKRIVTVLERKGSLMLDKGNIILGRVVEFEGVLFLMGNGTFPFPPAHLGTLLEFRDSLEEEIRKREKAITPGLLLDYEEVLRDLYFDVVDRLFTPPEIHNTDGDLMALHTLTYRISSPDRTFHALKILEQKVTRQTDVQLLEHAKKNKTGAVTKATLHWMKRKKEGSGSDFIDIATLAIDGTRMVVDVNSARRARRVQKEITKLLGDEAKLVKTEIVTQEDIQRRAADKITEGGPEEESEHDRFIREHPEAREALKEMMAEHWEKWVDIPIPVLNGMTPREAAKDERGKELLDALFMDFELRNRIKKDAAMRVDVVKLRERVGL